VKELTINGCIVRIDSGWDGCDKQEKVTIITTQEDFAENDAVVICSYLYDEGFIDQDEVALEVNVSNN